MKVLRIIFVALLCGVMFTNCGGGKGGEKGTAKETFSLEGLNAYEKAEKLAALKTSAENVEEGAIYVAEEFCLSVGNVRLTGNFNDIDNIVVEGELPASTLKGYKMGLKSMGKTKVQFKDGNFYDTESSTFQDKGQTYKQEGEVITAYLKNGKEMTKFYYKKGILWQNDPSAGAILIYKKKGETQE